MPDLEEKQIARLKQLLTLLEPDNLTKAEFVKSFEAVVNQILKVEKKISNRNNEVMVEIKDLFERLKSNLETSTNADISKGLKNIKDIVAEVIKDQELGMNFIRDKLRRFAEEKAKDDEKLKNELLARIPEIKETILDNAEQLRDKLEKLKGEERIDKSAIRGLEEALKDTKAGTGMTIFGGNRPLQIQEAGTVKEKVARYLNFTGATVSRSADGVVTVAVTGGGITELPATGAIDGSNTIFTFTEKPTYLLSDGVKLKENAGWTFAVLTATLSVPPQFSLWGEK